MSTVQSRSFHGQRWLGLGLLALILLALGVFMVPAHFGSISCDRDTTDWSVPIANRLRGADRLYEDGLHLPVPPLSFVLPRLLFPQGGIWLDGSRLNYAFQSGLILLLFWAFAGELGPGVALVTALAVIPVYLSMQKTMLYDSMAQFLVAAIGITTAALVRGGGGDTLKRELRTRRRWLRPAILGLLLGLLFLTKQNTAAGAMAGVWLSLGLLPRSEKFSKRCANVGLTLLFTAIVFCLVALAFHRFLSFSGLIHDVFLTGSEPKGGPFRLIKSLVIYSLQIGVIAGGLYLLIYIFSACVGANGAEGKGLLASVMEQMDDSPARARKSSVWRPNLVAGALAGFAVGLALALIYAKTGVSLKGTMMESAWGTLTLNVGLCLTLVVIASLAFRALVSRSQDRGEHPLAPYALVFLLSALFHNLSVTRLRWTVDNNPLVFLALALVVSACLVRWPTNEKTMPIRAGNWMAALVAGFIIFIMWPLADFLTLNIVNCTQPWPEVRHLAGARLRPECDGMRQLVQTARSFADPTRHDTVLLLPSDPNVESWFERDRPKISCAIIYPDQYWDRYVDADFAAFQAHPPKVIVIGPRNYWRFLCRGWHVNGAAERLIDRVHDQMIARDYTLQSQQLITFLGGTDYMDVYVRRDKP